MWLPQRRFACTRVGRGGKKAESTPQVLNAIRPLWKTPGSGSETFYLQWLSSRRRFRQARRSLRWLPVLFDGAKWARGIIGGFSRNSVARPHPKQ